MHRKLVPRIDLDQSGRHDFIDKIATMPNDEFQPLSPATHTGPFEELNIFGVATGGVAFVMKSEKLPSAPRGFMWRPLAGLSAAELRQRAEQYRQMAATARTPEALQGLSKLAERFDALADQRERGEV